GMKAGDIDARAEIRVEKRSGAVAVLDCDWAPGPVALSRAMAEAIGRARECHIGWALARNITHGGAIGDYALQAAPAGYAGNPVSAARPMLAYHGARVPGASTNPLAIAVPGGDHPPLLLDMSTSTVSMGKVLEARDTRTPIPSDWGIDGAGRPTTDADAVA